MEDNVHAGQVKRHGVKGRKDAYIVHLRSHRTVVAVSVHGEVIDHIDIQNPFAAEIVMHRLRRSRHGLQETVLVGRVRPALVHISSKCSRAQPISALTWGMRD